MSDDSKQKAQIYSNGKYIGDADIDIDIGFDSDDIKVDPIDPQKLQNGWSIPAPSVAISNMFQPVTPTHLIVHPDTLKSMEKLLESNPELKEALSKLKIVSSKTVKPGDVVAHNKQPPKPTVFEVGNYAKTTIQPGHVVTMDSNGNIVPASLSPPIVGMSISPPVKVSHSNEIIVSTNYAQVVQQVNSPEHAAELFGQGSSLHQTATQFYEGQQPPPQTQFERLTRGERQLINEVANLYSIEGFSRDKIVSILVSAYYSIESVERRESFFVRPRLDRIARRAVKRGDRFALVPTTGELKDKLLKRSSFLLYKGREKKAFVEVDNPCFIPWGKQNCFFTGRCKHE